MTAPLATRSPPTTGLRSASVAGAALVLGVSATSAAMAFGGLGIAPIAGIAGACAAPLLFGRDRIKGPGAVGAAAILFLAWVALTSLWSPYSGREYLVRLVFASPLYAATILGVARLNAPWRGRVLLAFACAGLAASLAFLTEAATGGGLTMAHRPPGTPHLEIVRNLGHGVSVLVVFLPVILAACWARSTPVRAAAIVCAIGAVVGGVAFGISSNLVGLAAGGLAMCVAGWNARVGVALTVFCTSVVLLLAPLIGPLATATPQAVRDAMPLSWELRLEAWRHVSTLVHAKPLFGYGHDASRTIDDLVTLRGLEYDVVPLHPHNAGLHLWLETGGVGVALGLLLIFIAVARALRDPSVTRPQLIALAGVIGAHAAISLVSYGIWQEWWVATGLLALAGVVALGAPRMTAPSP